MQNFKRNWLLLSVLVLLSPCVLRAQCMQFSAPLVPFTQVYYVTPPIASGDRLVVGKMDPSNLNYFPLPNAPGGQRFCDMIELAPGFFAVAYVPTTAERVGVYTDFAGLLLDPLTQAPFPSGIIPASRIGDPMAWRIKSYLVKSLRGDFNGDGKADVLWRHNTTGQLFLWLMDGNSTIGYESPGIVSDLGWQIQK
jgi:hypothetical protein